MWVISLEKYESMAGVFDIELHDGETNKNANQDESDDDVIEIKEVNTQRDLTFSRAKWIHFSNPDAPKRVFFLEFWMTILSR